MKIRFSTFSNLSINLDYLVDQVGREGIGYDPDFDSLATVVTVGEGEINNFSIYNFYQRGNPNRLLKPVPDSRPSDHWQPYQRERRKHNPYPLEVLGQGPSWITAWSRYRYTLIETSPGRQVWEYEGAEKGFLRQNLLPEVLAEVARHRNPCILAVEGTYGSFVGRNAFWDYQKTKRAALGEPEPSPFGWVPLSARPA